MIYVGTEAISNSLRTAMGQWRTGVTIVTGKGAEGRLVGLTATSFTSVSMEPPLVLVCIHKTIGSYAPMMSAEGYAVHILGAEQEALSRKFATGGIDKYADQACTEGLYGAPLLPDALATIECRTVNRVDAGDHTILIGQVERVSLDESGRRPLGYVRGKYVELP